MNNQKTPYVMLYNQTEEEEYGPRTWPSFLKLDETSRDKADAFAKLVLEDFTERDRASGIKYHDLKVLGPDTKISIDGIEYSFKDYKERGDLHFLLQFTNTEDNSTLNIDTSLAFTWRSIKCREERRELIRTISQGIDGEGVSFQKFKEYIDIIPAHPRPNVNTYLDNLRNKALEQFVAVGSELLTNLKTITTLPEGQDTIESLHESLRKNRIDVDQISESLDGELKHLVKQLSHSYARFEASTQQLMDVKNDAFTPEQLGEAKVLLTSFGDLPIPKSLSELNEKFISFNMHASAQPEHSM